MAEETPFDYYMAGHTLTECAEKFGVKLEALKKRCQRERWREQRRAKQPPAADAALGDTEADPDAETYQTADYRVNGEEVRLFIDEHKELPIIGCKHTYGVMAMEIAAVIPEGELYRMEDEFLTISETDDGSAYETQVMTPERFVTWLEQFAVFNQFGHPADTKRTSLSPAMAKTILAADAFRASIPEIREICRVRLPIGTRDGKQWIFAPAIVGYDPDTKIYTLDSIPFNWKVHEDKEAVQKYVCKQFRDFPFDAGDCPIEQRRSLGAAVTAMLGQFLHHNIDRFPIVCVNANQPGTGKSFLVRAMLAPMHGQVATTAFVADDKEFTKTLNSALFANTPYVFLDDVRTLVSNSLNRFVVSNVIQDRLLGTNKQFSKVNRMQFFATGNSLKASPDVVRRTLPIDLFFAADAPKRVFSGVIDEYSILQTEWRQNMQVALWSMVQTWVKDGCPVEVKPGNLTSFGSYVELAANIAVHAGFADPFGPRQVDIDTGDASGDAITEVLMAIADSITPYGMDDAGNPTYDNPDRAPEEEGLHTGLYKYMTIEQIKKVAERMYKLDIILQNCRSSGERAENIHIGNMMRGLKGREYYDSSGRLYAVGSRRASACNRYCFKILSEPTQPPAVDIRHRFDTPATPTAVDDGGDDPFAPLPGADQ